MKIDWDKWSAIELRQNRYLKDVEFCRERLDDAIANLRNCEVALTKTVQSSGLFRRVDLGAWMREAKADPVKVMAAHRDHPVYSILSQFNQAQTAKQKAAEAHQQAESALRAHSGAYHQLRNWIAEQTARGLI